MTLQEYLDKNYTKQEQQRITHLSCSDEGLTSLKGIENLINLKALYCYDNALTSLKGIEHCINLISLSCFNNSLTSLKEIENCTKLEYLFCENNVIKEIDLSNKKLKYVRMDKSVKLLNVENYKIKELIIK